MREEYDFSGGVRGKYAARYAEGSNIVRLDPDVAKVFSDSAAVNALRALSIGHSRAWKCACQKPIPWAHASRWGWLDHAKTMNQVANASRP